MPLIILVGIPLSGKTFTSLLLKSYFELQGNQVTIINEESLNIDKLQAYSSSAEEKNLRAALKSAVERTLTSDSIIILDSLNYIKGYRYELFCMVRQTKTTKCTIYLETSQNQALLRNSTYPPSLFADLSSRMEIPNQKNKWDNPLISIRENEEIPYERIYEIITKGRNLTENMATVKQPVVAQDYLHLAGQIVDRVTEFIMEVQENYAEGVEVKVPESNVGYYFNGPTTMLKLKKIKQQFFKINKTQPCALERVAEVFVEYVNQNLT